MSGLHRVVHSPIAFGTRRSRTCPHRISNQTASMSPESGSGVLSVGGSFEKNNGLNEEKLPVEPILSQNSGTRDEEDNEIRDDGSGTPEAEEKRVAPLVVPDSTNNDAPETINGAESQSEKTGNAESEDNPGFIRNRSALSTVTACSISTEYVDAARDKIDDGDAKRVENVELQIQDKIHEKSLGEIGVDVLQAMRSSYEGSSIMSIFGQRPGDQKEARGCDLGNTSYDSELMKNLGDIITDANLDDETNEDDLSVFLEVKQSESTLMISNIKQDLYAKARRHHPSIREAMLNVELESRKAKLELKRIELESLRVDAELSCILDNDDDDDDESEDGFFDLIDALSTFRRYMGGNPVRSTGSISTKGSTIYTKGSVDSRAENVGVAKMVFV